MSKVSDQRPAGQSRRSQRRSKDDRNTRERKTHGFGIELICLALILAVYVLAILTQNLDVYGPYNKVPLAYLYVFWPVVLLVGCIIVGALRGGTWWFALAHMVVALLMIWGEVNSFFYGQYQAPWDWGYYMFPLYLVAIFGGFGIGRLIRRIRNR